MLQIGSSFLNDKYTIEEKLGQGSLGIVYKARENLSGSYAAIKEITDDDYKNVLLQEIQLIAGLKHHNIVLYKTTEQYEDNWYLVMEYMARGSLWKVIQNSAPLSPKVSSAILFNILQGLSYLHDKTIIHRDLKPDNILFDEKWTAKISDFGISRILSKSGKAASSVGTVLYMAPEMFESEDEKGYDHRVDLYAAGILFYEMLTGKPPFSGSQASVTKGHLFSQPQYPEDLPRNITSILEGLLEKDREKRYQNAEEVLSDLRRNTTSPGTQTTPAGTRKTNVGRGLKRKQKNLQAEISRGKYEKTVVYEERIKNAPAMEAGVVKLGDYEADLEILELKVVSVEAEIIGMPEVDETISITIDPKQAEALDNTSLNGDIGFYVNLTAQNGEAVVDESFIQLEHKQYVFNANLANSKSIDSYELPPEVDLNGKKPEWPKQETGEPVEEDAQTVTPESNKESSGKRKPILLTGVGIFVIVISLCAFAYWHYFEQTQTAMTSPVVENEPQDSPMYAVSDDLDDPVVNSKPDPETNENMVLIPAGEFKMGDTFGDGFDDEKPVHRVYLDAFYIDTYEVTVRQYKKCYHAGKCKKPKTETSNWGKSGQEDHPINGVDWNDAKTYCQFVDKRLPSEAEWEKAATWKNGRKVKYPSGKNSISCSDAVMHDGADGCGRVGTWPVGSKLEEINGTYDMAGNVWEWVEDWYGDYSGNTQRNPKGPSSGSSRVIRGGSWVNGARYLRGSCRYGIHPTFRLDNLGFRCAASP